MSAGFLPCRLWASGVSFWQGVFFGRYQVSRPLVQTQYRAFCEVVFFRSSGQNAYILPEKRIFPCGLKKGMSPGSFRCRFKFSTRGDVFCFRFAFFFRPAVPFYSTPQNKIPRPWVAPGGVLFVLLCFALPFLLLYFV